MKKQLSPLPEDRSLISSRVISSRVEETGKHPTRSFVSVFEYPDCTRYYDGRKWVVIPHKKN